MGVGEDQDLGTRPRRKEEQGGFWKKAGGGEVECKKPGEARGRIRVSVGLGQMGRWKAGCGLAAGLRRWRW